MEIGVFLAPLEGRSEEKEENAQEHCNCLRTEHLSPPAYDVVMAVALVFREHGAEDVPKGNSN